MIVRLRIGAIADWPGLCKAAVGASSACLRHRPRARVAIISESLWGRRFGASPNVIGQAIKLDGHQYIIVGVMPATFRFWPDTEVWMNLRIDLPTRRGPYPFIGMGRLKPQFTFEYAQVETNAVGRRIEETYPKSYSHLTFPVVPLREAVVGNVRPALMVIFGVVVFVLLISTVNFANLLLARANVRECEIAVRTALGPRPDRSTTAHRKHPSGASGGQLAWSSRTAESDRCGHGTRVINHESRISTSIATCSLLPFWSASSRSAKLWVN